MIISVAKAVKLIHSQKAEIGPSSDTGGPLAPGAYIYLLQDGQTKFVVFCTIHALHDALKIYSVRREEAEK